MNHSLSGSQQQTFETIFRHPISHNLEWKALISALRELGEVEEGPNEKLKFSRNGLKLNLHAQGKYIGVDDLMRVRHLLELSAKLPTHQETGNNAIVVVDHKGARIFSAGDLSVEPILIEPEDPSGHDQQVHNPIGDSGGKQGPTRKLFYEAIANNLSGVDQILLVGNGHGASSEVEHLVAFLKSHHHENIEERIIGLEVLDLHHLTEPELLAKVNSLFVMHLNALTNG